MTKGTPWKSFAMANRCCRVHGGTSSGVPVGNQHALKHGLRTKKAIAERKMINRLSRERATPPKRA